MRLHGPLGGLPDRGLRGCWRTQGLMWRCRYVAEYMIHDTGMMMMMLLLFRWYWLSFKSVE